MNLHLHLGGKTGELVYASGCFPAIRLRWPGARLVLHLHPHYVPLVDGLRHQPDEVQAYELVDATRPLATQVTDCLRREHRARRHGTITTRPDGDTDVLLYGLHQRIAGLQQRDCPPFYRLFLAAADADRFPYERPAWGQQSMLAPTSVLVFASGNVHTGGARTIELPPADWERLADEIRAFNFAPIATGHRDDPRPLMPGWAWFETDDIREVLEAAGTAVSVLGLNSGITFAACQIAPGRVTMFDTQGRREYRFGPMYEDRVLDPLKHLQVSWAQAAEDMTGTVRRALLR